MNFCGKAYAPVLFSMLLAGCIGSYRENVEPAEGFYIGPTSDGYDAVTVVLENDQYWSVYGSSSTNGFTLSGLVQGDGTSYQGNQYYIGNLKDFSRTGAIAFGTLSASYSPGNWFFGSASADNQHYDFSLVAPSRSSYDYRSPASLSAIAGSWSMTDLGGAAATMQINDDGTFAGSLDGCAFSGSILPRASGRNVFNVAIRYGALPCRFDNRVAGGIAVSYLLSSGKRQLLITAANGVRDFGTAMAGIR